MLILIIESLSNDDGNANENVEKQWIKLQNTITARGNAATFPPSSLETERKNLNSRDLRRTWTLEYNESFQSSCSFKNKASEFSYSHTFRQNEKETNELYKQVKGKWKVKNSAAVFADVPVQAA